jgi:hypothetical protein
MAYMTEARAAAAVAELRLRVKQYRQQAKEAVNGADPDYGLVVGVIHYADQLSIAADVIEARYVLHRNVRPAKGEGKSHDHD